MAIKMTNEISDKEITESFIKLKHIKLKITDRCNLRCPKCDYWKYQTNQDLSTEGVKSLIDQGVELGLSNISLSGGEPTLRKDLLRIVRYGSSKGIKFGIITNGTPLNAYANLELAKAGITDWTFSIDTTDTKKFYESIGKIVPLDKVKENILQLANHRNDKATKVNVLTIVTSKNYLELEPIASLAKSLGADSFKIMPYDYRQNSINGGDPKINNLNLTQTQIMQFNECMIPKLKEFSDKHKFPIYPSYGLHIFGEKDHEIRLAGLGDVALGYYESNMCFMPWVHLTIFPDGDAYACCKKAYVPLGNVKIQSLSDIVHGEKMSSLRRMFIQHKNFDECKSCVSNSYENRLLGGNHEE
jgi:radical SAM protein with 4Fe4S-binding SPASM domain